MPTETAKALKVPAFSYRGFSNPSMTIGAQLIDSLGTGEPAYKLAPKSIPLADKVALYIVGRDLTLGIDDFNASALPTPIKEMGRQVYARCQERRGEGTWHKDGAIIEPGATISGSIRPGEGYVAANYFIDIKGFKQDGDNWDIDPEPWTKKERIWLPPGGGGFIVPASDGVYNPKTGTPSRTEADREKALEIWMEAGFDRRQAENQLSRSYRKESGCAAVLSWSSDDGGPMGVGLFNGPGGGYDDLGSFAASRAAERSEAPRNSGFRTVTEAEYKSLVAARTKLDSLKRAISE